MKESLFERVPESERLAWPDIASILSGVVSSLSKLMGGGIVAFYAGCALGGVAMAITFVLSFVLTYLVGKITFREGLPNNVVSRLYIFGTKGSAAGSLVWIFLLVGVLAVGTVQLGNAILFAFGWSEDWMRWALFIGISCVWVFMALFGTKVIARMNAVFVVALFCVMGYVVYLIAANGQMGDALTHGVLIPGVGEGEGFAYGVNYAIMTSGLLALFAADFTRFARRERDLVPISLVGSLFAVITYLFGALITYFGFEKSVEYFSGMGYDATGAAHAAITNPGVSLVLAAGGVGLAIICLSQMKVETSNSIGGANAVSNLFDSLFGVKLKWPVAVVIANAVGLVFILGGILDQVNAFMSFGSILTISWCVLLITDYYLVRGPLHIGARGIPLEAVERVNWRGVTTLALVSVVNGVLYATGVVAVPFLTTVPLTVVVYVTLSWCARDKVRAADAERLADFVKQGEVLESATDEVAETA
ncbi:MULTISPECIES: hypothetical protein [Gordonibacter]|uniref:Cytosine/purine permease NCS1 family protein n=1 Tax=Gordonibacter faecis TaxID=3047475 RepID=A0ABT7DLQ0_9ACTN|nr:MULTISPECIES: hypothetical protein [unclassified Gordonibacter]MDJ1649501.1 hypothetical protein [Gordonibacter sp. KGMB12511]HIW76343.1 hypothetical protein [Candidatus Gordonibacter avicola]